MLTTNQNLANGLFETIFKPTPFGIKLGQTANTDNPKVFAQATSDCLTDTASAEHFNQGIQGHCYTNAGDTLIIRTPRGLDSDLSAQALFVKAFDANAQIWKAQTGLELSSSQNGRLVFAPANMSLRQCFLEVVADNSTDYSAFVGMLKPEVLKQLGISNQQLGKAAATVALLEQKIEAIKLFESLGIKVPKTFDFELDNAVENIRNTSFDNQNSYIIKQDGLCGGFGNFINKGSGFKADELVAVVEQLIKEQKLTGKFQIQEFVNGVSFGALAFFDATGKSEILSVHKEIQIDSSFQGSTWEPTFQRELQPHVNEIFQKLSECSELTLLGSIGIDAIYSQGQVYVIECNPRLTGASPLALLLQKQADIKKYVGQDFEVNTLELDINVTIPAKLIDSGVIIDLVQQTIQQYKAEARQQVLKNMEIFWEGAGRIGLLNPAAMDALFQAKLTAVDKERPLILPQGISPFEKTKVLFVNDPTGRLKQLFLANLAKSNDASS